MGKTILAVVAGLVAWFTVALGLGATMRASWPAYAAVADSMSFTLPMMLARLALGIVATLVAGWVAVRIAKHRHAAALAVGVVLLAIFIPQHIQLWEKFPLWYHAFFLISLIPLALVGGRLVQQPLQSSQAISA